MAVVELCDTRHLDFIIYHEVTFSANMASADGMALIYLQTQSIMAYYVVSASLFLSLPVLCLRQNRKHGSSGLIRAQQGLAGLSRPQSIGNNHCWLWIGYFCACKLYSIKWNTVGYIYYYVWLTTFTSYWIYIILSLNTSYVYLSLNPSEHLVKNMISKPISQSGPSDVIRVVIMASLCVHSCPAL